MPTSSAPSLAAAGQHRSAPVVEIVLREGERFLYAESGAPQDDDHRSHAPAVRVSGGVAHYCHHLLHGRRVGGVPHSLVARRAAGVVAEQRRWRATPPRRVEHGQHGHGPPPIGRQIPGPALHRRQRPGYRSPPGTERLPKPTRCLETIGARALHESAASRGGARVQTRARPDKAVPSIPGRCLSQQAGPVLEPSRASGEGVRACRALARSERVDTAIPPSSGAGCKAGQPDNPGSGQALISRAPAGCRCASIPGCDLATTDGRKVRVRTLRIADERGVGGHRDVAGAAPAGGPSPAGRGPARPGGHRLAGSRR
jgi:hypothetical protein